MFRDDIVFMKKNRNQRMTEYRKVFLAFQRAVLDLEKSFAQDPFKYCDYDYQFDNTIHNIIRQLKEHEYRPRKAESFDLPKGEYAIRPGVIVDILDLTVINRLLLDFIHKLDKKLPAGVTAYRLRHEKGVQFQIEREAAYYIMSRHKREKIKLEESWYNLWPLYRKELLTDLKSGQFKFVAKTDITAYFEDINLVTLGEILKKMAGRNLESINIIIEIYRNWALRDPGNIRQSRGLPQGSNVSGLLSNYYLNVIDSYLEDEQKLGKIKWYRYCDDIHVLAKTRERAVSVLLKIGGLLRKLGLNQSAEKTFPLTAQEAIDDIFNETAENITSIIERTRKKKAKRHELVAELRQEYRKISRQKCINKKFETTLFRVYTAALILDYRLLTNRAGKDFERFPVRAKQISNYARRFINYKPVFRYFSSLLHDKKRILLYNYQLAFLMAIFRNLNRNVDENYKHVKITAFDAKRHWYVRVQAICTLSYFGNNSISRNQVNKLLEKRNHPKIRRATMILIPQVCTTDEIMPWVNELARELDITSSRMANFMIELMRSRNFALNQLKKFGELNYIYLGDQIWRLWFIALNSDIQVKKALDSLLKKMKKEYGNNKIVMYHVETIRTKLCQNKNSN